MPKNISQYDLLISCPGDVTNEISIIESVVSRFNTLFSDVLGINIRTKHWSKNSYAQSGGKPQTLLNEQFVNDCDAAVAIFWTRFGTPTDEYESGTEEEIDTMLSSGKRVFMYFSDKHVSPSQMNEEDYEKVQAFREKYKDRGIYFTYSSDEEFATLFFAHLSQHFLSEKRVAEVKGERHSELKLVGIDQNQQMCVDAPVLDFASNVEMTTKQYLEKIRNCFQAASLIKVEEHTDVVSAVSNTISAFDKPVLITEFEQDILCSLAEMIGFNIDSNFFSLGNLSKSVSLHMIGEDSLNGTKKEKEKYQILQRLLILENEYSNWMAIEKAFSNKKCLKLALQNCGTAIDEDVEVSLAIPRNSLLSTNEFPEFDNDEMGYLLNDCDMSELFGICSTSTFSNYDTSITSNRGFSPRVSMPYIFPGHTPDYSDAFESELADVFCYSCFAEGEKFIVKLKFDYIKHNTTIAFPSVLFIKEPFGEIPYTITSKNSSEVVSGEINVMDDT